MTLRAVVLDIEGTTSSTRFVHETLYPYSSARFASWVADHRAEPRVEAQLDAIRQLIGEPQANEARCVEQLLRWLSGDEKVTPLKAFQGWIWDEGFAAGELTSHFYPDAIPAMRQWNRAGLQLSIFSSGSVSAQRAWFGHTPEGDLLGLFGGRHFDTENTGPKRVAASYERIATALAREPSEVVFLSDLEAELDAATEAGWHTVGVRRPGDQYYDAGVGAHLAVHGFDELDLAGDAPRRR
jgi:enolase-phosphatase E1